jgi:hypothetical protein
VSGIEGTIGIRGRDTNVDVPFSDLIEFVEIAGSPRFETAREGFGIGASYRWGG